MYYYWLQISGPLLCKTTKFRHFHRFYRGYRISATATIPFSHTRLRIFLIQATRRRAYVPANWYVLLPKEAFSHGSTQFISGGEG